MSEYFIKRVDKTHGPFSTEQIKSGLKSDKLKNSDLISEGKDGPWMKVEHFINRGAKMQSPFSVKQSRPSPPSLKAGSGGFGHKVFDNELFKKLKSYLIKPPNKVLVVSFARGFQLWGLFMIFLVVPYNFLEAGKWQNLQNEAEAADKRAMDEGIFLDGFSKLARMEQEQADAAGESAAFALVFGVLLFGFGTALEFDKVKPLTRRIASTVRDHTQSNSDEDN